MSINPEAFPGLSQAQVAAANAVDGIPPAGDPSTEALANQTIAALEKEFAYVEGEDEGDVPAQVDAKAPQDATEGAEPAAAKDPEVPPAETKKEPTEAGLERLVAREIEIRERERTIEAREAAVRAKEGQADPRMSNLIQGLRTDPEGALKAAGVDVDHAVRLIIAKRLGDKAPPELKAAVRDAEIQRELNELRAHNRLMQAQAEARSFYEKTVNGAREYVKSGVSKDAPALSDLAKEAPDWVHERVIEEIVADAQNRLQRQDKDDNILSFSEAAKRVEKKLNPVLSRRNAASTSSTETKTETQPVITKPVSPQPKQPSAPRPLRPWQAHSEQDLLDAGIKEALMEFRKQEGR